MRKTMTAFKLAEWTTTVNSRMYRAEKVQNQFQNKACVVGSLRSLLYMSTYWVINPGADAKGGAMSK